MPCECAFVCRRSWLRWLSMTPHAPLTCKMKRSIIAMIEAVRRADTAGACVCAGRERILDSGGSRLNLADECQRLPIAADQSLPSGRSVHSET